MGCEYFSFYHLFSLETQDGHFKHWSRSLSQKKVPFWLLGNSTVALELLSEEQKALLSAWVPYWPGSQPAISMIS